MGSKPSRQATSTSAYDHPRWGTSPRTVYYYHLTPVPGPDEFDVKAYYYERESRIGSIKNVIRKLALNARADDAVPPLCGDSVTSFPWRRKSYIVFLIDSPVLRLVPGDAIQFYTVGGSPENHTFFDAEDFDDIDLATPDDPGAPTVSAVCFINHMKRAADGIDLDVGEMQHFHFRLNYGPRARGRSRFPDSGGTNMGPPVPPP
jgi:hypothetical protein